MGWGYSMELEDRRLIKRFHEKSEVVMGKTARREHI